MKKSLLLSAVFFMLGSGAANAGSVHLNVLGQAPAPVYVVKPKPEKLVVVHPRYHRNEYCNDKRGHRHICANYRPHHKLHHIHRHV